MNSTAIECKLIREGGTRVEIENTEYHFAPYTDGAHVCEVANEEHADRFLSIREGYRLYRGEGKPTGKPAAPKSTSASEILLGGDFPASFDINEKVHPLGNVVAAAHAASGLTDGDWNALPQDERDSKIEAELDRIAAAPSQAQPDQGNTNASLADDRAALAAEYERLYGKKPHHNTGIDKLRELIAAKQ